MLLVPTRMHLCSQQAIYYAIPLNEIGTTINSRAPWGKMMVNEFNNANKKQISHIREI